MFLDEIVIKLTAGNGGDGCTSFRHEAYVAMGGPDGGNGGKGSNIIFEADTALKTLVDLRVMRNVKGEKGVSGKGQVRHGKNAEDIIIKVPTGTTVFDDNTGLIIDDLINDKQQVIAAYGGRGGKGNKAFATHSNPAPRISEFGEPGEERMIKCELKVMADIGLVGMPSVGKSTILAMISASKPKIGAYHFTTLSPNLGVVKIYDYSYTIADLPGLIEGSSSGLGLGDRFLRHTMRTKIIAHVIDMGSYEGRNPIEDYETIVSELNNYSDKIKDKKQIVIANKMDLEDATKNLKKFKSKYPNIEVLEISAINNTGLDDLMKHLAELVKEIEAKPVYEEESFESHVIYKFQHAKPYEINKKGDIWVISGKEIEKFFKMTKFDNQEGFIRFSKQLQKMGIEEELEKLGAKKGDSVQILNHVFELKI